MITIVPFLNKVNAVILNPALKLLFAVAFIYFIYSVIQLINADAKDRGPARSALLWSIVGMFVMISVYGIIHIILSTFAITPPSYLQGKVH